MLSVARVNVTAFGCCHASRQHHQITCFVKSCSWSEGCLCSLRRKYINGLFGLTYMASLQLATFPPLSSIAMWNKTILVAALTLVALPLPGALAYRVPDNSVLWSQGSTLESAVTNLKGLIMDGIQRSQYEYPVPDKDAVELFFNDVFRQRQRGKLRTNELPSRLTVLTLSSFCPDCSGTCGTTGGLEPCTKSGRRSFGPQELQEAWAARSPPRLAAI
ncbi:hypothetical protein L1887_60663 [Cichorium endivia]|nr:hypothetical protein L1887_60663 [Cichorium endivia]